MATPSSDPTFSTPLTTLRAGVRQKQESPRARVAWRRLGQIAVGVVLLLLIGAWGAGFGQFLAAVAATAVVALIACLLTGEGRVSRIWRGALHLTGLLTWIPGATHVGQVFFVIVSKTSPWRTR